MPDQGQITELWDAVLELACVVASVHARSLGTVKDAKDLKKFGDVSSSFAAILKLCQERTKGTDGGDDHSDGLADRVREIEATLEHHAADKARPVVITLVKPDKGDE
jgi:hypothetical protein